MKRIIVKYGCGYGRYETDFEVDDDVSEEDIETMAQDCALERFEWTWVIEGESA